MDDGSRDRTAEIVRERFGGEAKVTLISVPNGGKAKALNVGFARARGDVSVALDADTEFDRDTISRLVRWFADPKVGAVAGNAKVGNRVNMITRWQALEYIVAQNLERRALAALGTLTVVPARWELGGARLGRNRRLPRRHAGRGPGSDHRPAARWIQGALRQFGRRLDRSPRHGGGLAKQRFRWPTARCKCLWKYRDMSAQSALRRARAGWRCRKCGCSRSC